MKTKSKMLWRKVLTLALTLFFMMPAVIIAQAGNVNFSGTWAFNQSKSTTGGGDQRMGGGASPTMTVTQTANTLSVTRAIMGRDGGSTSTTTNYSLDGKETVTSNQRGESKSVAVWSSDRRSLTITTTRSFNGMDMKTVEVWTIDSSNALSIKSDATTPQGNRSTTLVYDKR